jgi:hypothetical protein
MGTGGARNVVAPETATNKRKAIKDATSVPPPKRGRREDIIANISSIGAALKTGRIGSDNSSDSSLPTYSRL